LDDSISEEKTGAKGDVRDILCDYDEIEKCRQA
jgi:hypothetical protein